MKGARRLSAADSWFLDLEGPTVHLHVTGVLLIDPAESPRRFDYEAFTALLAARMGRLDALRERIVPVPGGIDHPVALDVGADLDDHLERVVLPGAPGSREASAEFHRVLSEFVSTPLDRSRPLWAMLFVEGLPEGRVALVAKLHHALVDGVSGVGFMGDLLDLDRDAPPGEESSEPDRRAGGSGVDLPSRTDLLRDAVLDRALDPLRPIRAVSRTGASLWGAATAALSARGEREDSAAPFAAPRTSMNGSLSGAREVAFTSIPLEEVKALRRAHEVPLNDVLLAAVSSALRDHLQEHGGLPDRPLVAAVPVSVHDRSGTDSAESTNQVSNMFVNLPVPLADPLERLAAVHRSALRAKAVQGAMGPEMLGDLVDLFPPGLLAGATSAWVGSGIANRIPPVQSLIVSNVPGPDFPLYMAGAEVVGLFPFGPLMEGSGLNVTALSHNGRFDIGVIACPDLVPEVDRLVEGILGGFEELRGP